ncbi:hypothetical protein TKK_0005852 [Trichogramma kaykai]|uniref:Uncharacterized protein n=1 Tax=Trichogramma kaykai TaxID=54128 RepID=A0ABD2XGZ1_9HYME
MVKVESDSKELMIKTYDSLKKAWLSDHPTKGIDQDFVVRHIIWILKRAIDHDDYDVCRSIIVQQVSRVRARDQWGNTPVHYAARERNPMALQYLFRIYSGAQNFEGQRELTHFHAACASGQHLVVQAFVRLGVDANKPCSDLERFPILLAVRYYLDYLPDMEKAAEPLEILLVGGAKRLRKNALKVVQILMQNGADSSVKDHEGRTLLWKCIVQDSLELLRVCLLHGLDPNLPVDATGGYGLHLAVALERFELAELLIKHGADMSVLYGPLPMYAIYENVERDNEKSGLVVELILRRGHDPNVHHHQGLNLVHGAIINRKPRMLELLLSLGADPNYPAANSMTPLQVCAAIGHYELMETLLSYKADPNVIDVDEVPIVISFAVSGHIQVTGLLVEYNADLNRRDSYDRTALHCVFQCCINLPYILGMLLEGGADPNLTDQWGKTPLHYAAALERLDAVELLLSYGANPDVLDRDNRTPLYYASDARNRHVADALIYRGGANTLLGESFKRCRSPSADEASEDETNEMK